MDNLITYSVLILILLLIFYINVLLNGYHSLSTFLRSFLNIGVVSKNIIGSICLTGGSLLIVYGFIEINSEKNTVKGMVKETLTEYNLMERNDVPIIQIILGGVLVVVGITLLMIKKRESIYREMEPQVIPKQVNSIPDFHTVATAEQQNIVSSDIKEVLDNQAYKYCGKCGARNKSDNTYCVRCGEEASV